MLAELRDRAEHAFLLGGLRALVELLIDAKLNTQELLNTRQADQARLVELETKLAEIKSQFVELNEESADRKRKMAARQVLHNVNEKILRQLILLTKLPASEFWTRYKVRNFGVIMAHKELLALWPAVLKILNLPSARTPRELWDELKFGKEPLDTYVHDSGYEKLSQQELIEQADAIFTGKLEKVKSTFLEFLNYSVQLGGDLYT